MNAQALLRSVLFFKTAPQIFCLLVVLSLSGAAHTQEAQPVRAPSSKFSTDAGPLVRIERPGQAFLIPQGYFRSRVAGYADKHGWWLEALWPGLTPWRENNPADDKEFHAPGGGRMIKMIIDFGGENMARFLNRLIDENEPGDPKYGLSAQMNSPHDTLDKRIKGEVKFGLQPYYVDFDKVLVFLNANRAVPITSLDEYKKSGFKDWFIQRDKAGTVSTLIICEPREVPDPPEASITGRGMLLIPRCDHKILLPKYNAYLNISYRRVFLPQWQAIEHDVRALLTQFETTQP